MTEEALSRRDDRLQIPELARRARLRRFVFFGVVLLAIAVAVAYYRRPQAPVERYRTDAAAMRTIVQLVEATGSLDVRNRVEVPAPIAGRLVSVHVQPREEVKKGKVLAMLDERAVELALRSARVTVEAASGHVGQAQVAFDAAAREEARAKALNAKGLASAQDLAAAKAESARAKAALQAARAERKLASETVASAELGKSLAAIVAPVSGVVLDVPDRLGAAVSPERGPLFVIGESLDVMKIEAPVSETEIALLSIGATAEVLVQALPGKVYDASVQRIGIEPKRDSGVVHYPVTLFVDNKAGALLPGMSARVRLEVARASDVLSVHEAALRFTPEGAEPAPPRSRVWRKQGTELQSVTVEIGISDGVYTEVKGDLSAGDALVIGLLRPGEGGNKPKISLGGSK